jgi:hypothetical protein
MGVERELKSTFGFSPHGMGVGSLVRPVSGNEDSPETLTEPLIPDSYGPFLVDLNGRIRTAQLRASMAVNQSIGNWSCFTGRSGRDILDR